MIKAPRRFKTSPSLAILFTLTSPVPKTTALGIVATGNMKAQLALIAAGIISRIGSMFDAVAAAPKMGISTFVVAVLLVISVRKVTSRHTPRRRPIKWRFSMPENTPAILALNPDCLNPSPKHSPAPTKTSMPQGI